MAVKITRTIRKNTVTIKYIDLSTNQISNFSFTIFGVAKEDSIRRTATKYCEKCGIEGGIIESIKKEDVLYSMIVDDFVKYADELGKKE